MTCQCFTQHCLFPGRRFRPPHRKSGRKKTYKAIHCNKKKIPLRRCSSPLSPLSLRRLDPIKLAYNPCRLDGRLKLTASAFNRLKPAYQQSWSQGTLLCRTRCFFPSTHCIYPRRYGQAEWPEKYRDVAPAAPNCSTNKVDVAQLC